MLRPFPVGIKHAADRQKTYARYRQELIAQAGIAIFVMGNKAVVGEATGAEGVRTEYELAKAQGLYLLPIGASGWMASELWTEVMADIATLFPKNTKAVRPLLTALGTKTDNPDQLLVPLLKLIDILTKE